MTCPKQFVSQPVVTEILDQSAVHDELRSDTCCAAERRLSAVEVGEPLLVGVTAPLGDHRGVGCPVQCSLQPGYLALRVVSCCLAWSSSSVRWSMVVFRSATWCWFASSRDSASERSDSASCNRSRPPQHVSAAPSGGARMFGRRARAGVERGAWPAYCARLWVSSARSGRVRRSRRRHRIRHGVARWSVGRCAAAALPQDRSAASQVSVSRSATESLIARSRSFARSRAVFTRFWRRFRYSPTTSRTKAREQRIGRQLPRLDRMRLQPERPPDPRHRTLRHPRRGRHRPGRPVRVLTRGGFQRLGDHLLDVVVGDRPRPTRARLIGQPVQPTGQEPRTPLRHHVPRHPNVLGDLADRAAIRTPQHDPGPQRQRLRRFPPPGLPGQHGALLVGQHHRNNLRARHHHSPPTNNRIIDSGH
jgi:hypothetical protein